MPFMPSVVTTTMPTQTDYDKKAVPEKKEGELPAAPVYNYPPPGSTK
jgi:hypothetical protein